MTTDNWDGARGGAVSREAEDEQAVKAFLKGEGSDLDPRVVRNFMKQCRHQVGPDPVLRLAKDMVLDGVWYEWGVWPEPRGPEEAVTAREESWDEEDDDEWTSPMSTPSVGPIDKVAPAQTSKATAPSSVAASAAQSSSFSTDPVEEKATSYSFPA